HGDAGQAEPGGAVHVAVHCDGVVARGRLRVAVVLDDEDGGQVPHRGQVQALQEHALVGGAVAHEADRDLAFAAVLGGQGRPARERGPGAQDAVGAHHAPVQIGDVHGTAFALAGPTLLPVDLLHHLCHVHALGDAVAVAPVGAGDTVAVVEVQH